MLHAPRFVGSHVKRVEDPRLIQGQGAYLDDLAPAGTIHLVFVRSPHAHARIARVDVEAARRQPGVVAVLTATDVRELPPKPIAFEPPGFRRPPSSPLAADAVRYVG